MGPTGSPWDSNLPLLARQHTDYGPIIILPSLLTVMRQRLGRRYDAVTQYLRRVISNENFKETLRLQAALRLSEILLEHDRSEARKEIARERMAARQAEASSVPETPMQTSSAPQLTQEQALKEAKAFLARTNKGESSDETE
jgi:hypothetical protein